MVEQAGKSKRTWVIAGAALVLIGVGIWAVPKLWRKAPGDGDTRLRGMGAYEYTGRDAPYYGHARLFSNPATVHADDVYARIPEYQEIVSRGLSDTVPEYTFLLQKASKKFSAAVKAAAKAHRHDLVGEFGTVGTSEAGKPAPPDLTAAIIEHL